MIRNHLSSKVGRLSIHPPKADDLGRPADNSQGKIASLRRDILPGYNPLSIFKGKSLVITFFVIFCVYL